MINKEIGNFFVKQRKIVQLLYILRTIIRKKKCINYVQHVDNPILL